MLLLSSSRDQAKDLSMGTEYEVLSGLNDGATVVTGGQIRLKDGIKVSVNE